MSNLHPSANIGRIERGCVLDVVTVVLASIKRGHPERDRGHSKSTLAGHVQMLSDMNIFLPAVLDLVACPSKEAYEVANCCPSLRKKKEERG